MSQKSDRRGNRIIGVMVGLLCVLVSYLWFWGGSEGHRALRDLFDKVFSWETILPAVVISVVMAGVILLLMYLHRNDPEPPKCPHCGQVLPEGHDRAKADKGGL